MATLLTSKMIRAFGRPLSAILSSEPFLVQTVLKDHGSFRFLSQLSRLQLPKSGLSHTSCLSQCPTGSPLPTPTLVSQCTRLASSPYTTSNQPTQQEQANNEEPEDKLYKWIELKVKGHEDAVLESYTKYVNLAASELDINVDSIAKPFRNIKRLTLLKSRHVYKKHRVQYEMRTYYRVIRLKHLTGSTASVFLEYIQRNLPEGVAMQVKKCSIERLPVHLQSPPEQLSEEDLDISSSSSSSSSSESEDEAQDITK
ncbi:28S ribosomal protein S10, mitochondrial [Strongylocentrotus purpuratus]|uniref:Small ribosomal subunit protein uS10m n=1 Tax=Strongylocentrotus purpuratus TaxID=7668 RepID=A0A7M7TGQ3_STRPU|nr:28S ribosomal protein S10, mitochondrial [Strongylocentrotus purpuratus]